MAKKKVDASCEAFPSKGMKAPRPGSTKMGEVKSKKLEPSKGKQPPAGSKKVEQASQETASMKVSREMGKSGKGYDGRAAAAESAQPLQVKGVNKGQDAHSKMKAHMEYDLCSSKKK